jgi:DNA-binding transcriptional MerR regulator/effector-binding domain-containing protein
VDVLLSIGELSKMTYLSVKALRHYHEVGLLTPVEIDPSSGYRRYGASQVATAQAIRRFRDLDMPIDDVRQVLAAPDGPERDRVIVEHLARLQEQLARTQASVASLQALLTGDARPPADVQLRHLAATPALAARRVVGQVDCAPWLEVALADLHARADALDLVAAGPEGALWPDAFFEDDAGEVIAFFPLASTPRGWAREAIGDGGSGALELIELPAVNVAMLVHEGSFADADQTYGALGTVVAERGIGGEGPIRERYVADDRIEVCWPVTVGRP